MMSEKIEGAPPSSKLVYKVLEQHGALTQKQIAEESILPTRTVRDALERLRDRNIVSKEIYIPDARQRTYRITGKICEKEQTPVQG